MWCRLITGEQSAAAEPMSWQRAGAPPALPAGREGAPLYAAPDTDYKSPSRHMEEQIDAAYQRGLREGEAAAARKTAEQMSARLEQLARSIEQLALHRAKIQREAEPELVRLSLAIARRILRRELSVDPESLMGLLKAGLDKIENAEV